MYSTCTARWQQAYKRRTGRIGQWGEGIHASIGHVGGPCHGHMCPRSAFRRSGPAGREQHTCTYPPVCVCVVGGGRRPNAPNDTTLRAVRAEPCCSIGSTDASGGGRTSCDSLTRPPQISVPRSTDVDRACVHTHTGMGSVHPQGEGGARTALSQQIAMCMSPTCMGAKDPPPPQVHMKAPCYPSQFTCD